MDSTFKTFKQTRGKRLPLLFAAASLLLLGVYPLLALSLQPGKTTVAENLTVLENKNCDPSFTEGLDEEFISDSGCPSVLRVSANIDQVDLVDNKKILMRMHIYPDGDLGLLLENGGVLHEATILSYDGMGETNTVLPAAMWTTGQSALIPISNVSELANYPFDNYSGTWSLVARSQETGITLPIWLTAEPVEVAGFNISMNRIPQAEDIGEVIAVNPSGVGQLDYEISRSSSDIFQAIFLAAVLVISLVSATITTYWVILGRRPPSLGLIGWLATFLFSVIGLRTTFPGNPPIGVNMDKFITFPTLVFILLFIVINAWIWLRRDDWDMGNEMHPH